MKYTTGTGVDGKPYWTLRWRWLCVAWHPGYASFRWRTHHNGAAITGWIGNLYLRIGRTL